MHSHHIKSHYIKRSLWVVIMMLLLTFCHKKTVPGPDMKEYYEEGRTLYQIFCMRCHQAGGKGLLNVYPPVAESDYMMADKKRSIEILLKGMEGEIKVNGVTFRGTMEKLTLTDMEIAKLMTFLRVKWNKGGDSVSEAEVREIRESLGLEETVHDPGYGRTK